MSRHQVPASRPYEDAQGRGLGLGDRGDMTIEVVRGRYKSEKVVTVGGSGGAGFRDDFGSTASLSDWELSWRRR